MLDDARPLTPDPSPEGRGGGVREGEGSFECGNGLSTIYAKISNTDSRPTQANA